LLAKDASNNVGNKAKQINLQKLLDVVAKITQPGGSVRGVDERELMFGKMFGCLSIIRSGRLINDSTAAVIVFRYLCELYLSKVWMREAVVESVIQLLCSISGQQHPPSAHKNNLSDDMNAVFHDHVAPKIWLLLTQQANVIGLGTLNATTKLDKDASPQWFSQDINLQSMSPAQLSLLMGLQMLQLDGLTRFIPVTPVVNELSFSNIREALINSTAGFPKVLNKIFDFRS
jgi:hypothetical protein